MRLQELRFGLSHFGKTLLWSASEVYALFALTDLFGFEPGVAGGLFLAMLVWSAGCDALAGAVSDHLEGPKADRMMQGATVFSAVGFVLSMTPLPVSCATALGVGSAFVFRACFAFYDVPHNAILARLAASDAERAKLATIRLVTGAAATMGVAIAALILLAPATGLPTPTRYLLFAAVLAGLGAALSLLYPKVARRPTSAASVVTRAASWRSAADPRIVGLFLSTMASIVAAGAFMKSLAYISKYVALDEAWVGRAVILLTVGKLAATPGWVALARLRGPRLAITVAYGLIGAAATLLAAVFGAAVGQAVSILLVGAAIGGMSLLSWTLVAGLADDLAGRLGFRLDARLFGLFTCVSKIATGMSGAALGLLLARLDLGAPGGPQQLLWGVAALLTAFSAAAIAGLHWTPRPAAAET